MKILTSTALVLAAGMTLSFQAWADELEYPEGKPFQAIEADFDKVLDELGNINGDLSALDDKLDALIADVGNIVTLVPFMELDFTGGICNTAVEGSANPEIIINSDGVEGHFVVTSVLLKTDGTGVPTTGFFALSINSVRIDGTLFDTRTGNLVGATDGSGVLESADLMGTPVRRSSFSGDQEPGGNFPHQIVAESDGNEDIRIRLFCRSDDEDLDIAVVAASGWKHPDDTITVTLVPGI